MRTMLYGLLVLTTLALLPTLTYGDDVIDVGQAVLQLEPTIEVLPPAPQDDDPATPDVKPDEDTTTTDTPTPRPPADPIEPGTLRFFLMDGSVITGKLATDKITIKTEFGELVVPITSIQSFSPGLASHPKLEQQIQKLIEQLAAPDAKQRDLAQAELLTYGSELVPELERYANDADAERKVRIATIVEELLASDKDDFFLDDTPQVSLLRLDSVVTQQFTMAGEIQQTSFKIESKFGMLEVQLADIKAAQTVTTEKADIRMTVDVQGSDMAGRNWKNTRIRVNKGDRIIINADGRITMTPWGNNVTTGPDGMPQNGSYNGNIPMGALCGRIGDGGEEFMVGGKKSFVAERSGTLYLGFAMQQNWQNYQFPGSFEAKVRVVPAE